MGNINKEWAREPIAIIGLSCKFAGDAASPEKLWKMLAEGRNAWSEIPSTRFNPKGAYHPDFEKLSTTHVKGAHFIEEDVGLFDAAFFSYSAETASAMDPQYRIQLESSYEALENAGLSMSQVAGSNTSVYAGIFTHDYHEGLIRDEDKLPRFLPIGTLSAMASNRISHFFDLRGASMTVDTGCSTSLVALHQAVLGLRTGEADMSIVSGCNLMLTPDLFKVFSSLGLLGPDGKSYAFDSRANGYGRGEGVGTIVIKRLRDALAAGDPIRAVIRETYLNQDGKTETITSPSQQAQEALIRECYRRAGLSPRDTQYFEAHGTGTPTGDPIEARAIAAVFRAADRTERLRIGSVKTNIGHTEAASGLAGLIKVVLAMEKGQIPPSVNFDKPNPKLKLDEWGLKVATELEPWPATGEKPRRASVNSFGYGGPNSHVILEDSRTWTAPTPIKMDLGFHVGDRSEVLLFYGRDEQACQRMVCNTKEYLRRRKLEDADMGVKGVVTLMKSLCFTLSRHRTRFPWVSAHAAPYSDDLDQVIRALDAPQFKPVRLPWRASRIGMVFTGQGAQWHAMGRELINAFPIFRSTLFAAEVCLRGFGADWSLMEELGRDAASSRVNSTALSIPVCVAVQIALVRLLRFWGISPTAVTSHSSGEIAAAYTAGALTLRQAMAAAYYRASMAADKTLMNGSGPNGAMVAVGVGREAAQGYIDRTASASGKAVLACINSPSSVTVAGDEAAVREVEDLAIADGVFARRLRVDTGYHSHHMMPIAEPYRQALRAALRSDNKGSEDEDEHKKRLDAQEIPEGVHWAEPYSSALRTALAAEAQTSSTQGSIAFSSPVTGGRITRLEQLADPEHWVARLLQPVQFVDAFTDMVLGDMDESGTSVDVVLEVGPHTALGGPIKEMLSEPEFEGLDVAYMSCLVRNEDSRDTMRAAALHLLRRGLQIDQANISFPWGQWPFDPRVLTDLPSYPWNHSIKHWSEARQNQAYRQRDQEPHELLGALAPGTNLDAACWRQQVRVSENPWLRDHVVQGNILYPGAGFVCLAIEGMKQLTDIDLTTNNDNKTGQVSGYRLRDVKMLQALVVPDNAQGVEVQTVLRSVGDEAISFRGWKQFEVSSVTADGQWTQHAKGFVTIEIDVASPPVRTTSFLTDSGFTRRVDPEDMFATLRTKGLNHGPMFQNTTSIVQDGKSKEARCATTIEIADLGHKHVLHPTTLDSVFISSYAALPGAGAASDDSPKVPQSIQKLWVSSNMATTAGHSFACNTKLSHRDARSYEADVFVVDGGETVLELQGFVGQSLGRSAADAEDTQPWTKELCAEVEWAPDLALSLGLPGALPAVKKKLSPPKEMESKDREVLMALRRVCVYFCHDAVQALTEQDVARLAQHHVKFYADTWTSHGPQERQQYTALAATQSVDGELICQLGPVLVPILRGERAPLEAMMEGRLLYKYYANVFRMGPAFTQFTSLLRAVAHKNPRARVLEIGAGTGAATRHALTTTTGDTDKEVGPPCETWHFTDISSGFFEAARSEFAAWGDLLEFDRLDIEQSPESQGFNLASYDIVVACQVLHATKSMSRTMDHVHRLMKPGATLLLMETTQDQVDLQFIFGLLPGWWLSEEPERRSSPSLSVPLWEKVLKGAGFSGIDVELRDCETDDDMYSISNMLSTAPAQPFKLASDSIVVVVSGKAPPPADWLQSQRESIAKVTDGALPAVQTLEAPSVTLETYSTKMCVFVGEMDQPVLHTLDAAGLQGIKAMATGCKGLLWVTRGAAIECVNPNLALATGFLRVLRSEYVGRRFPTLDLDPSTPVWSEPGITAIVHVLQACLGTPDDVYSITAEAAPVESEFAVRDGLILVPRVSKDGVRNKMLTPEAPNWAMPESIPEAPLFQDQRPLRLEIGIPGLLDTLAFNDDKEADVGSSDDTQAEMVEIEPRAYGLNFRDVMVAMGQLRERVMGLECAGIITRVGSEAAAQGFAVGDRVMALLLGPYSSRARVGWHGVAHMPEGMSFDDAASLPMIFSTAYVGLVDVARLRHGQSVLIHAAAGGVGQAAIMLAKDYLGADVYATVGSQAKRDLLTREYGIPPERIFNSRDASFAPAVLAATGGRGVDVVLNSLAGPLLQAGFDVLAPFGHFVEIGKRDLEGNSLLEMATFSRVASFTSLDMMTLLRERGPHVHRVLGEVARLVGNKAIGPIHPVTVFPMRQVARAFRLLQTGKHTGKIVMSVEPDEEVRVLPQAATPKLRPDASYLLVGGIGGLGRSIAYWMVDHGARNLILLSRSAGKQNSGAFVSQLREAGCRVVAISCDVANNEDLARALDTCERDEQLPPVRGVIQGAMVLQDSILEQMTLDDWQTAIRPKVAGSWNLHSRFSQPRSLDFFVMLSSLSCILGWASQTNYAAGGSYQDALARRRQTTGLPAVSIDIGIVKGVGYVAESRVVSDRMRRAAHSLMLPDDAVLRSIAAAVLHPFDQPQILLGLNSGPGPQWDPASESQMGRDARFVPLKYRRPPSTQAQQLGDGADAEAKPLSALLQEAGSRDKATQLVGDAIAAKLGDIFMIPMDDIDLAKPPALYGVDSLVAVELRNMLMLQAASDVSIFSILQSASLAALASDVVAKSPHVEMGV
ncbi:Lovastatin diketide synthase LovF [Tolypocladium ophioglossoides CBS 100239]|uniref:Lovastatin diketide synthase LovF n=1 Tax=Tolypocladium ophioglossoides (strain CBS 100239) TaxID=1163406 RepID=A0A0L0N0I6_TOLOC|nr:Lovastatin diketide synthase LovF [Tolypocladium ophioglossoides CBS 100239]